ncbi:uncharacterized protein LOC131248912 [Magnolia sinica]|uniref:uncharacterized protein LOC131248912 n=1 Tax=Magnolia sinica TaxID=86752 RepID=UPI00265A8F0F|nr:uncharacterized protein LOC131248912 [Magnolia sinica]
MGNEMGNRNVSGLKDSEEENTDPQAPNVSLEAPALSSDTDGLQDKNILVSSLDAEDFHGNQKRLDSVKLSETSDHANWDQTSAEREQDDTAVQTPDKSSEALMPTSSPDGIGDENPSISPLESEDLHEKLKNPDSANPSEQGNHQIQNETLTGREEEEKETSMESNYKKSDDHESNIDICSESSLKDSSAAMGSDGDIIKSIGLCDSNGEVKFGDSSGEKQLGRTPTSQLNDVESVGDEDKGPTELDAFRIDTTELSDESVESFYLEAIESEIKRVCLGDNAEVMKNGAEIEYNEYGQNQVLVSEEDGEVSATESKTAENDTSQTEFSVIGACEENTTHGNDGSNDIRIEKAFQVEKGEEAENEQEIGLHNSSCSPILEEGVKDLKIERDDAISSLSSLGSAEKCFGEKMIEETENSNSKGKKYEEGIEQVDGGFNNVLKYRESDATSVLEENGCMNERERNPVLPQSVPIEQDTENSLVQEAEIEHAGIETETPEEKETSDQENCMNGSATESFGIDSGNPIAETSLLVLETEKEESELDRAMHQKDTQIDEGSSYGGDKIFAVSMDLSQEKEPACGLTEFSIIHEPKTDSEIPESKERSHTELNQENLSAQFDTTETFGVDFENQWAESAVSALQRQKEDIEQCPSLYQTGSTEHKAHASERGETDQENISIHVPESPTFEVPALRAPERCETDQGNISIHVPESPTFEVSALRAPERCETDQGNIGIHVPESPTFEVSALRALERCETDQGNIGIHVPESPTFEVSALQAPAPGSGETDEENPNIQIHVSECPAFDFAPLARNTEVSALEAKNEETTKHEAPESERAEQDEENLNIQIDVHESSTFEFSTPVSNNEVSALEKKTEECEQHPVMHQAITAKGDVSQTQESSERSIAASSQEDAATADYVSGHSCFDFKNPNAETEFPLLEANKEDSLEKNSVQKGVPALERSNSEKLKTPLLSLVKKETYDMEPLQKQESIPVKKNVDEVWKSPKKDMATSAKGREKTKQRYSLFSHCMCCTTVIQ